MAKQNKKIANKVTWSHEKDSIFKELAAILVSAGYDVRREELKTGHGWKVMSGTCRYESQKLIFVDKKLPQDEQITFLVGKIADYKVQIPEERKSALPEKVRSIIDGTEVQQAA